MTTNEKKCNVRQCELDLERAKQRLREARLALDSGSREAKARYERDVEKLRQECAGWQIQVEKEQAWLVKAKRDLEDGCDL